MMNEANPMGEVLTVVAQDASDVGTAFALGMLFGVLLAWVTFG